MHGRRDKGQMNCPTLEFLRNSMTININDFGPLMKNQIVANLNGILVVAVKRSGSSNRYTYIC